MLIICARYSNARGVIYIIYSPSKIYPPQTIFSNSASKVAAACSLTLTISAPYSSWPINTVTVMRPLLAMRSNAVMVFRPAPGAASMGVPDPCRHLQGISSPAGAPPGLAHNDFRQPGRQGRPACNQYQHSNNSHQKGNDFAHQRTHAHVGLPHDDE